MMDDRVLLRPYRAGDREGIKELNRSVLGEMGFRTGPWHSDLDSVEESYLASGCFWVAESGGGEIVGMVGVQGVEESQAELKRLRVRKEYRRNGIGSRLVDLCIQFCREKGYRRIVLDTAAPSAPGFQAALSLYESKGFVLDGFQQMPPERVKQATHKTHPWDGKLMIYHPDL